MSGNNIMLMPVPALPAEARAQPPSSLLGMAAGPGPGGCVLAIFTRTSLKPSSSFPDASARALLAGFV